MILLRMMLHNAGRRMNRLQYRQQGNGLGNMQRLEMFGGDWSLRKYSIADMRGWMNNWTGIAWHHDVTQPGLIQREVDIQFSYAPLNHLIISKYASYESSHKISRALAICGSQIRAKQLVSRMPMLGELAPWLWPVFDILCVSWSIVTCIGGIYVFHVNLLVCTQPAEFSPASGQHRMWMWSMWNIWRRSIYAAICLPHINLHIFTTMSNTPLPEPKRANSSGSLSSRLMRKASKIVHRKESSLFKISEGIARRRSVTQSVSPHQHNSPW